MPGRYQFSLPERPSRDGWFRVGSIDVTTTALMVGLGILSIFWYAIDKMSLFKLVFAGSLVRDGDVWRLATWPIANPLDQQGLWVVLTLAFFWFVGHRIEDNVGRTRFTWLLAAMTILPAALVTIIQFDVQYAAYGLGTLGIALLVIFALDNPTAMFFFGIPAWVIAAIYVGIDALRYLGDRAYEPLVLELAVITIGLFGARQCGLLSHLQFIPQVLGKRPRGTKAPKRKGKLGGPTVVSGPWAPEPAHSASDQTELDLLLDKISANGIDSLSKAEKARLNDLSKKLRGR
ncbi:MAG: rhomboid family intramembrane serine protease [Actinomycetota bacterium]|nr:rhomboid family intramembrane serine protease [Actinomycetota bacterium]